jgi:hypothetical protein
MVCTPIDFAASYKYLGLHASHKHTTRDMIKAVVKRGHAAVAVLNSKFDMLGVASNVVLKRNLFDALVQPNLTFGCEVWGPWFLDGRIAEHAFDHDIERVRVNFYRQLLQLRKGTSTWCLFKELGEYPILIFIVRQCIRFYQKLLNLPTGTWARTALLDAWVLHVQGCGKAGSWFDPLVRFFRQVGIQPNRNSHTTGVWLYDESSVLDHLRKVCHGVFTHNPPSKVAYYQQLFVAPFGTPSDTALWRIAPYLTVPAPAAKLCLLARLRLRNHYLRVETATWSKNQVAALDNWCEHCGVGCVEDEHHLLFACPKYDNFRSLFPALFANQSISNLSELVKYDKKKSDWPLVIRNCCKFLELTGKIFKQ